MFLPALMKGIFPSERVTDNWVTSAAALPADLRGDAAAVPQLAEVTNAAMTAYRERLAGQQMLAEDRLLTSAPLARSVSWWGAGICGAPTCSSREVHPHTCKRSSPRLGGRAG